ncbi:MAG: hypothetical protein ACRECT_03210 [Thermoplasmata archaeon]
MAGQGDRGLAVVFGILATIFLLAAAVLRVLVGIADAATGHGFLALGSASDAVIFFVMGILVGVFTVLGRSRAADRSLAVGIILIVLAIVGWLALGFGGSLLAILAAVFALISGILFLVSSR